MNRVALESIEGFVCGAQSCEPEDTRLLPVRLAPLLTTRAGHRRAALGIGVHCPRLSRRLSDAPVADGLTKGRLG